MEAGHFYDETKNEEQPQPLISTPSKENKSKISHANVAAVAPGCKFFEQGRCTKDSACPFTHAAEAMGENGPCPSVAKQ